MSTIWTLTVENTLAESPATTVHVSKQAAFAALRANYDDGGELADLSDGDMVQSLIDSQGLIICIGEHEVPVPAPVPPTRVRVTTREVLEGGNDFDLDELEDSAKTTLAAAGSLEALLDAALERDPYLHERVDKYNECVESDRTVRFLREGEV